MDLDPYSSRMPHILRRFAGGDGLGVRCVLGVPGVSISP